MLLLVFYCLNHGGANEMANRMTVLAEVVQLLSMQRTALLPVSCVQPPIGNAETRCLHVGYRMVRRP